MDRNLTRCALAGLLAVAAIACTGAACANSPRPASAEALDIDDSTRASMEKQTLKQRRRELQTNQDLAGFDPGMNTCGQISIGNAQPASGTQRLTGRDTTVIVTGPVISAANCR